MDEPTLPLETRMLEELIRMHNREYSSAPKLPDPFGLRREPPISKYLISSKSRCSLAESTFLADGESIEVRSHKYAVSLRTLGFDADDLFFQHVELNRDAHPLLLREHHPDYEFGPLVDRWLEEYPLKSKESYRELCRTFPGISGILCLSKPVILEDQRLMIVASSRHSGPMGGRGFLGFYHLTDSGLEEVSLIGGTKS